MAEYDTLTIRVEADSKQANTSIKNLSSSLQHLDETAKGLDTKRIIEVKGLLQSIAKIDFSNVIKGLQSVVSAFKAFSNKSFQKAINSGVGLGVPPKGGDVSSDYVPNWEAKGWSYSNDTALTIIKEMRGEVVALDSEMTTASKTFQQTIEDIDKQLPSVLLHFRDIKEETITLEEALRNAGFNSDQIKVVMSAIHKELKNISPEQLEKLRDILIQFGASAEQADNIVKGLAKDVENAGKKADKSTNGFKKLLNQFKNIMKYRIIRKIIQEIYKALQESIQNVIEFDEATSKTINELSAKFEFLKNSLGAMFAPLIQIVAPMLNMIMQVVGELGNTFAEFFAGVNGQTTFSKAKDDLEGFNKEAKKTATLGIDELNIIGEGKNDFFTTEQVNLGEQENALASQLGEVFAEIKDVVGQIVTAFRDLMSKILPAVTRLLQPIISIIKVVLNLVTTLVDVTFGDVNTSLASFTDMIANILGFISEIVNMLNAVLLPVMHILAPIINIINTALSTVFDFVGKIFNLLQPMIRLVTLLLVPLSAVLTCVSTIFYVLDGIIKTFKNIFTLNFADIGKTWEEVGQNIKKAWEDMGKIASDAWNGVAGYATGGFPEDGFFFANHNELVGKFSNGQTAVANNDQIVEGIKQGVLEAMQQANSGGKDIIIQIDGKEIAKAVNRQNANSGYTGINGGYKYGY